MNQIFEARSVVWLVVVITTITTLNQHGASAQLLGQLGNLVGMVDQMSGLGGSRTGLGPQTSSDSAPEAIEIMRSRGFIGEMYKIKSSDGAPLTAYHLINPLADPAKLNKYPVVMFHGLGGDGTQMISNIGDVLPLAPVPGTPTFGASENSLAFLLANNNFDVWLMDARGTNLNNHDASDDFNIGKSQKFWNYCLDEQILHDVPTLIKFVLDQTQSRKVMYIGYSESTFFMFALLSAVPEFADKLAAFVALAPVAYVTHLRGLTVPMMAPYLLVPDEFQGSYIPQPLVDTLGVGVRRFCGNRLTSHTLCGTIARGLAGQGDSTDNGPQFFSTLLHSTSLRVFKHFLQLFSQRRFGMYDYGPAVNLVKYGQSKPPAYPLSQVRLPTIILVRGGNDFLSTPEDQQILVNQLGTKPYLDINIPYYNHLDFILAKDVAKQVNIPILKNLHQILLADGGSFMRDKVPVKLVQPHKVAYPNKDGTVSNMPIQGRQHLIGNLLEGLEYKKRLGALPVIGNTLSGYMGGPGALDAVQNLGWNVDKLGDSLENLPNNLPIGSIIG